MGVEQIAATDVPKEFLERPYTECACLEPYRHALTKRNLLSDCLQGLENHFSVNLCFSPSHFLSLSLSTRFPGDLLGPFSVGYIKGFKRCAMLLVTLQGIRELGLEDSVASRVRAPCFQRMKSTLNTDPTTEIPEQYLRI